MTDTQIIQQMSNEDEGREQAGVYLGEKSGNIFKSHTIDSIEPGMVNMRIDPAITKLMMTGDRKFVAILYILDHDEYHKLSGNIPT